MRKFKSMGQAQRLLGAHAADGGKSIRGYRQITYLRSEESSPRTQATALPHSSKSLTLRSR